jgi:hypothetical protein
MADTPSKIWGKDLTGVEGDTLSVGELVAEINKLKSAAAKQQQQQDQFQKQQEILNKIEVAQLAAQKKQLQQAGLPQQAQVVNQQITAAKNKVIAGMPYDVAQSPVKNIDDTRIIGPYSLQHEGRLRNTGTGRTFRQRRATSKPCGHWAIYAWTYCQNGLSYMGVTFTSGYRCYYPDTAEAITDIEDPNNSWVHAIRNAESGSYFMWDYFMRPSKAYIAF